MSVEDMVLEPKTKQRHEAGRRPQHLDRYWTTSDLVARYGRHPRALARWQETRGFPKPLIPGGGGAEHRWLAEDILAWEDSLREAAKNGG